VLVPGVPLGLLTEGVQVLAGVLLPSATVFLLLLCNDRDVLGPWVNGTALNAFTSAVIEILITLSVILTASVLFPAITAAQIGLIAAGCGAAGVAAACYAAVTRRRAAIRQAAREPVDRAGRANWRMPPLAELTRARMSPGRRIGMGALRLYLLAAMILVIIKIVQVALGH
jgi:hypothetical protein